MINRQPRAGFFIGGKMGNIQWDLAAKSTLKRIIHYALVDENVQSIGIVKDKGVSINITDNKHILYEINEDIKSITMTIIVLEFVELNRTEISDMENIKKLARKPILINLFSAVEDGDIDKINKALSKISNRETVSFSDLGEEDLRGGCLSDIT